MQKSHGAILLAVLCMLCMAGCGLVEKGGRQPALSDGNTLTPPDTTAESTAAGGATGAAQTHPRLGALAPLSADAPQQVDPHVPLLDKNGLPLCSAGVNQVYDGAELTSAAGMGWVVYAVAPTPRDGVPETLHLRFARRDGTVWLALANFAKQRWDWQALADGGSVDVPIDATTAMRDGALYFTLAVHGGASAVFSGGDCALPGSEITPPETELEQPLPDVIGAYLSLGYWDTAAVDATMAQLHELGVNLVLDYALIPPEDDYWQTAFQHYLDAAQAQGIGIAFSLGPQLFGMAPDAPGDYIDNTVALVEQLKGQDAITAWYVHDEVLPDVANDWGTGRYAMTLAQMQQLYARIHSADPERPQLNVWCYLPDYTTFREQYLQFAQWGQPAWMQDAEAYEQAMRDLLQTTCDLVLADSYPVGAPWGEGATPEAEVTALCSRAAALKAEQQPLVFVFQSFSWAQYDPEGAAGAPFPTQAEMEAMLCAAHTCGATGAVAYSWFDLADAERDAPGRDAALTATSTVLTDLSSSGWPAVTLPLEAPLTPAGQKATAGLRSRAVHQPHKH